jgi:thiamine-monophosphate kinase
VHFFPDDPAGAIARKALRVNLSDLAAKGAAPLGFLLGLGLPQDLPQDWLAAFAAGLGDDATAYGCPLLGGDTVQSPAGLTLSITAIGTVPEGEMVRRAGVAEGDLLYVTGTIGDAALGLRLRRGEDADQGWITSLDATSRAHLASRYLLPEPRLGLVQALRGHARSAMDISDGFAGDLAKLLRLAGMTTDMGLGDVPLSDAARQAMTKAPDLAATILSGGDDYEILCAVAPAKAAAFEAAATQAGIGVKALGRAHRGVRPPIFRTAQGPVVFSALSYQHF